MTAARLPRPNPGIICVLAGLGMTALHFSFARGSLAQAIVFQAAGILGASTIAIATLVRKPERSRHWWLLAAALGLWTIGDAILSALGLSTVYRIAKQNGGAVDLETAPGRGTTFTIYLPRTQEEVAREDDPVEMEPEGQSETILLVEDERSVRTLIRRLLEVEGYIVVTAESGEDALLVAGREAEIDLVLTDMVMPGMNGRELIEQLELSRPGLKVVYTSGHFDDRANAIKGAPFLQKPYTHQALARTVREALAS